MSGDDAIYCRVRQRWAFRKECYKAFLGRGWRPIAGHEDCG